MKKIFQIKVDWANTNEIYHHISSIENQDDWTEYSQLLEQINYQNQLISDQLFDPFSYFGWSYIKDYKFYKDNPRLEVVFIDNKKDWRKEGKLNTSSENYKTNYKSQSKI